MSHFKYFIILNILLLHEIITNDNCHKVSYKEKQKNYMNYFLFIDLNEEIR